MATESNEHGQQQRFTACDPDVRFASVPAFAELRWCARDDVRWTPARWFGTLLGVSRQSVTKWLVPRQLAGWREPSAHVRAAGVQHELPLDAAWAPLRRSHHTVLLISADAAWQYITSVYHDTPARAIRDDVRAAIARVQEESHRHPKRVRDTCEEGDDDDDEDDTATVVAEACYMDPKIRAELTQVCAALRAPRFPVDTLPITTGSANSVHVLVPRRPLRVNRIAY